MDGFLVFSQSSLLNKLHSASNFAPKPSSFSFVPVSECGWASTSPAPCYSAPRVTQQLFLPLLPLILSPVPKRQRHRLLRCCRFGLSIPRHLHTSNSRRGLSFNAPNPLDFRLCPAPCISVAANPPSGPGIAMISIPPHAIVGVSINSADRSFLFRPRASKTKFVLGSRPVAKPRAPPIREVRY